MMLAGVQDKLKEACSAASDRAAPPALLEQGKLAARLRAELEVHKEALAAAKQEVACLASSLDKANSMIEVCLRCTDDSSWFWVTWPDQHDLEQKP